MFTSDMFTGTWGADPGGPWIVDETNDDMTAAEMEAFMLNTRYWWLRGAKTDALRRGLGELYAKCGDVEILAPGYGKIFKGSGRDRPPIRIVGRGAATAGPQPNAAALCQPG